MRQERAFADPRFHEGVEAVLCITAGREGVGIRGAEPQAERGADERDDHGHAKSGRQPAPARDGLGPAGPHAACLVVRAPVRPVELVAELGEDDGQKRDGDERRDQRDQHAAVAHRAQERERQRDQRQQADRNRDAAEDDSAAGLLHRDLDRLVAGGAVGPLLAPARDDDERVVDRHAQADQRDQELDDRRDRGDLGQAEEQEERGHDRDERHDEWNDGQERGEHEDQDEERTEPADERLEQKAGPVGVLAGVLEEGVEAREVNGRARDGRALKRGARCLLGCGVLAEGGLRIRRGIDDGESGGAVGRDERVVAGRGIGSDAGARERFGEGGVDLLEVGDHGFGVDGLALRQGHDRKERRGVAARAAVVLGDDLVGLPALLVRDRELGLERLGRRSCGRDPRDRQKDPADGDDAFVCENPAGETCHW